jgi:benzodiazapine receptor
VFFALQMLWPAVVIIGALWLTIVAFIALSWGRDRVSAWLLVPYLAWVSFATLLNVSLAVLN